MISLEDSNFDFKKCGTVTVSVFKDQFNKYFFKIKTDTDEVLPVSYVIEDTLYLY